ncbi:nuclear transport factor 2 family protein [Kitasatospora sp. LaBMicrA B282]|uniref:nuclear transport factor 2 family protein n=1 Tax=Kitasatospora sp. LaBMicrA B282 TaxID=3420949 RepID=UPI003D0D928F
MPEPTQPTALDRLRASLAAASNENRVRSFLHRWLLLLEQPAPDAEPLRELLADDLEMTLSDGRVLHTFEEVAAWYAGARELVGVSIHHIVDLVITPAPDGGSYQLAMDFSWQGIANSGRPMTARTRHRWTLTDTGERFLRLSRFAVTQLEPFAPVTAEEALAAFRAAC